MSELLNCGECGHVRYIGNEFNGLCASCEMWAEDQITALRAEVAALKAMYEGPLTDEEVFVLCMDFGDDPDDMRSTDAAIRQVRRERGTK